MQDFVELQVGTNLYFAYGRRSTLGLSAVAKRRRIRSAPACPPKQELRKLEIGTVFSGIIPKGFRFTAKGCRWLCGYPGRVDRQTNQPQSGLRKAQDPCGHPDSLSSLPFSGIRRKALRSVRSAPYWSSLTPKTGISRAPLVRAPDVARP